MIGEEVNTVIDNLCQKFSVTQELLIPEMARLCIARSWVNALFCGLLFILSIIAFFVGVKKINDDYDDVWCCVIFSSAFIIIGAFIALWVNMSEAIQWQAAPTAKAVEYVLEMVRGR